MKKALSILLAMGMTVGMVAGCGDTADNSSTADNSAAASTEAGTDGTQAAASAADIKVGVIYIGDENEGYTAAHMACLLYTSPSPRDGLLSRMPSSA